MNKKTPIWRTIASFIASTTAVTGLVALSSLTNVNAATTPTNGVLYYNGPFNPSAPRINTINADGTAPTNTPEVLKSAAAETPFFSSDGTKIGWIERTRTMGSSSASLKVANPDGSGVKTLATSTSGMGFASPQFSADGKTVYVSTGETSLYALDAATENQTLTGKEILTLSSGTVRVFDVSSTGKIAYLSYQPTGCPSATSGIVVRDLNASGTGTLVPGTCASASPKVTSALGVFWNNDGTKMYVAQEVISNSTRQEPLVDEFTESGAVSGTPFFEFPATDKSIYEMALSPDGTKLALFVVTRSTEATDGLYILDLATKVSTKIATPSGMGSLTWAPVLSNAGTTPTTVPQTNITATPGVTVTDPTVYTTAPKQVASGSSITVLSPTQMKTQTLKSTTPDVCLPTKDDIVFIEEGRCTVNVLNKKSGEVLRRLRTTVVEEDIVELGVGNEVAILAPIYFDNGATDLNKKARTRIRGLKDQISAAGTVMVVGHSGIMLGDTPENRALSRARAESTVREMKRIKATGPFYSVGVGAADPAIDDTSRSAQSKNRRVIIVLVP